MKINRGVNNKSPIAVLRYNKMDTNKKKKCNFFFLFSSSVSRYDDVMSK